jgi:hypothetical protein
MEDYREEVKEGLKGSIKLIETFKWDNGEGECSRGTIKLKE